MVDERLCVMPAIYGHEVQRWNAAKVFSRLRERMPDEYHQRCLRTKQVAELLDRTPAYVRELCIKGKLQFVTDERGRLFSLADISDYICNHRQRPFSCESSGRWTQSELDELQLDGYCVSRSKSANKTMKSKIKIKNNTAKR